MKPVQARDDELKLDIHVGKFVSVSANTPDSQAGGFYCELCECQMKDSQNYLDHINGKKRNYHLVGD
jgi:U4/U6.U5 tri-snRNP component SNU23